MAEIYIGINNCFAIGRFPEPEAWLGVVKNTLGLSHVQFSFDLLDPLIIDDELVKGKCAYIKRLADEMGVTIETGSTGEVPHKFNLLLDPDPGMRSCYLRWYEKLIRYGSMLGVEGSGVYLGTLSQKDQNDIKRREYMISVLLEEVVYLTSISREVDQKYFIWEPMSIPREMPCTINETKALIEKANEVSHVPVRLCLDVGHGYFRSDDPRDRDPYAWLREFADISPCVHMQQTDGKGSRHWPFTKEYNSMGIIVPEKIFEAIEQAGSKKTAIIFEFFFSAHAESDENAINNIKRSVEYWQEALHRCYS